VSEHLGCEAPNEVDISSGQGKDRLLVCACEGRVTPKDLKRAVP